MAEEDPLSRLQQVLNVARLKRGLGMAALSRRSGLSRTTVSQAFNSRRVPTKDTLAQLAPVLGLLVEDVLELRNRAAAERYDPKGRGGQDAVDAAFEARYRDYLLQRHGRLTIVGLDLRGPAAASWPLDTAYLSLELAGHDGPSQRVDRAERALAGRPRTLVRGLAGSGKTTLLQWLACATAEGQLPDALVELSGSIAFVLPLRTLARTGGLPADPAGFLAAVNCSLAAYQPPGWAHRVLSEGRGLVLVDGLDEVPKGLRDRAGDWLRELVSAYGHSRFVVTTRPSAVADGWLFAAGFRELAVRPMGRRDVGIFVSRWHAAARAGATDPEVAAHLDTLESDLKDKVRVKRDLALLTTTPLLCALVCALHRDRRGRLPSDRVELYQAALSMLITRRDQEREVIAPEGIELSEKESVQLLQKLAYWLVRNGQTELQKETALSLVEDALESMHTVAAQGDAGAVLGHLLSRTGLLRAPTLSTIDFVHRTFQDFLGAKAAVESLDLPLIVRNAHDEQWEDVVRMAVAHARPAERAKLLEDIIRRADREVSQERRLLALALACLQHATELPAAVRERVEARAQLLMPPRSASEVGSLVDVGPLVLDLLPGPEKLAPDTAPYAVETALGIGGDGALAYLKAFTGTRDPRIRELLGSTWSRFDPCDYVSDVLRPLGGRLRVTVQEERQARAISGLPVKQLALRGGHTAETITGLRHRDSVTALTLEANDVVTGLDWIGPAFPHLRVLELSDCQNAQDLGGLLNTRISCLTLDSPGAVLDVDALGALESLRVLGFGPSPYISMADLPRHEGLRELSMEEPGRLDHLNRWPALRRLLLPGSCFLEQADALHLPRLKHLTLVDLRLDRPAVGYVAAMPWITSATVHTRSYPLAPLARLFPGARALTVSAMSRGHEADIRPLAEMPGLRRLTLKGFSEVRGTLAFPPGVVRLAAADY
ncbi:NACHT domain-containing protein [Streptomyces sp. NPDC101118]|uniref:NACHT domain-containing protein n=1 Tax=Streptomyces sp. NPDC101118 TaxID=3366109 RepID=UPI003813D538